MRARLILTTLALVANPGVSRALQASDTMAAWRSASADDRAKLVDEFLRRDGDGGSAASITACLDSAAGVAGHADLPIVEVAKACRANGGDPV